MICCSRRRSVLTASRGVLLAKGTQSRQIADTTVVGIFLKVASVPPSNELVAADAELLLHGSVKISPSSRFAEENRWRQGGFGEARRECVHQRLKLVDCEIGSGQ